MIGKSSRRFISSSSVETGPPARRKTQVKTKLAEAAAAAACIGDVILTMEDCFRTLGRHNFCYYHCDGYCNNNHQIWSHQHCTLHTLPPPIERLLTGGRGGGRKMIHLMIQLFFFLRDHCYNSLNSQHNKIFLILKLFYRSELFCFVSLSQSASKSCPTADISPCE